MGHVEGHPCNHGVYPYAMCEYCDELHIRATSFLVEQHTVLFGRAFDIVDEEQLDDAAVWLVDIISAIVPEACTGGTMAGQVDVRSSENDKG